MSRIYPNWPTTKYKSGCEKLNKELHGIEIQAAFPVKSGTVVEVSCSDRRIFFFFFFLSVGAHFTSPFWRGGYVRLVANVSWSSSGLQEKDRTWLGEGFARLVLPEDITGVLWPGGSATSRRTSAIGDPSSVDSLEPVGESGVETPYRNGVAEYCEELPPLFASGPAR